MYSAESDCTAAIKLDETYVKAYHRRASARIGLKRYKDAVQDLEKILELEPANKEAAALLKQIQTKIEKSFDPMIISGGEKPEKSPIEKLNTEKLLGKNLSSTSPTKSTTLVQPSESQDANKDTKATSKNKNHPTQEKVNKMFSDEELEKDHVEANKFKDEGNTLVQKQQYVKAIEKYSQAIKIFPYDSVYFANRALCQLKLDK